MRVHVICRLNQARSIISSAVIRKIYPELEVFSSGILAQSMAPIPQVILDIAERWGLAKLDHLSTNFSLGEVVRDEDLLLCADSSIYLHLSNLGVPGKLIDVSALALDAQLVPTDPVQMSAFATEIELAKMSIAVLKALNDAGLRPTSNSIDAIIFSDPQNIAFQEYLKEWLASSKGVAIDMNWQIPDPLIWRAIGLEVSPFNPRSMNQNLGSDFKSEVISSEFEIDNQIDLLSSNAWISFLRELDRPALLLINQVQPDSQLDAKQVFSLIHAGSVKKIGQ